MLYRVTWTIDIDAHSFSAAARKALKIHRNPDSIATIFDVRDSRGVVRQIDLPSGVAPGPAGTVFVVVPMDDGFVRGVQAFCTRRAAKKVETAWLCQQDILNKKEREHKADWGTGIAIWECEIKP